MPTILFSSLVEIIENFASNNIACELIKLGFEQKTEREWVYRNAKLIDTRFNSALNVPTHYETDYFIVLSPHKSKTKLQSLTVHIPGNWGSAEHGGKPRTLNISYASKQYAILRTLFEKNKKYELNFNVNYEVDHHGPTIDKPIIFVEIGSSENEWKNPLAAKIIAEAVFETINENETQNSEQEKYFGVGGGHYAPIFTRYALEKKFNFGHMLPKYKVDTLAKDTFTQAIEKNIESISKIILDEKGLNKEQRENIEKLAKEFKIKIEKV